MTDTSDASEELASSVSAELEERVLGVCIPIAGWKPRNRRPGERRDSRPCGGLASNDTARPALRSLAFDVPDVARMLAHFRALHSCHPCALFNDPFGAVLAGDRGRAMANVVPSAEKPRMTLDLALRTRFFDDVILQHAASGAITAVLSLGAGFDMRPYRLSLPRSLSWIEVDFPDVVGSKSLALADQQPVCAVARFGLDLTARGHLRELLKGVTRGHANVLVLTEGVLPFLSECEVHALASELHACPAIRHWAFELAAPHGLDTLRQSLEVWLRGARINSALARRMRFAPERGVGFFRESGWAPNNVQSAEAGKLQALGLEKTQVLTQFTPREREFILSHMTYVIAERATI